MCQALLPIFSHSLHPQSWKAGLSSSAHFTDEVRRLLGKGLDEIPELMRGAESSTQARSVPEKEVLTLPTSHLSSRPPVLTSYKRRQRFGVGSDHQASSGEQGI